MVSSKWIQVESPSPFRFLAALMPPCAQTECERFTGTIENRSTSPPISAILMTAARPARPPPTTIILGAAIRYESDLGRWWFVVGCSSLVVRNLDTTNDPRPFALAHHDILRRVGIQGLRGRSQKAVHADSADRHQAKREREANITKTAARRFSGCNSPFCREQPQAVTEVPGGGDDADGIEGDHPRILKFELDFGERLHGMRGQVHAGKAQEVGVLHHKDERDDAGVTLGGVEPVTGPGIAGDIALALIPDIDAVEAVVGDGNPDEEQFEEKDEGQTIQKFYLFAVGGGTFEGFGVGDEMFEQESADGN